MAQEACAACCPLHNVVVVMGSLSQNFLSCHSIPGVIGSLDGGRNAAVLVCLLIIPFKVHSSKDQEITNGSPSPATICSLRTAERYPLIEECCRPSSIRCVTNKHECFSDSGKG